MAAHNTIQFDGHDQMPRLSRVQLRKWLKSRVIVDVVIYWVLSGGNNGG